MDLEAPVNPFPSWKRWAASAFEFLRWILVVVAAILITELVCPPLFRMARVVIGDFHAYALVALLRGSVMGAIYVLVGNLMSWRRSHVFHALLAVCLIFIEALRLGLEGSILTASQILESIGRIAGVLLAWWMVARIRRALEGRRNRVTAIGSKDV